MALELELGVFLSFLAVPFVSLIFLGKIKTWGFMGYVIYLGFGMLGFLMLGGLALAMAVGYDVVLTSTAEGYTSNELQRDNNGDIVSNTTITVPDTRDVTPVIDGYQDIWAMIFFGAAILFGLLYFKVMVTGEV